MVRRLEEKFPGLSESGYTVSSPVSTDYNCIAWAAGDTKTWWWPLPETEEVYWPSGVTRAETITAFREAFTLLRYIECSSDDLEPGFEKVALFTFNEPGSAPTPRGHRSRAKIVVQRVLFTAPLGAGFSGIVLACFSDVVRCLARLRPGSPACPTRVPCVPGLGVGVPVASLLPRPCSRGDRPRPW